METITNNAFPAQAKINKINKQGYDLARKEHWKRGKIVLFLFFFYFLFFFFWGGGGI